jgi:hypothetical protein
VIGFSATIQMRLRVDVIEKCVYVSFVNLAIVSINRIKSLKLFNIKRRTIKSWEAEETSRILSSIVEGGYEFDDNLSA